MATVIEELVALLGYDLQGEEELKRFNKSLDNLEKKAVAVGAAIGKFAAVAGVAVAGGMAYLAKSVVSTNAEFEKYAATLETLEGSSEKAQAALDWVSDFAKATPYDVAELTEAFVRLRAYGLDPMSGLMEGIGDVASAMGKSLEQAVEAYADAMTGEFERLKEFGLRAKQTGDEVTFAWSENGKAMTQTVRKNSEEIAKFLDNWDNRFAGAMERQSKTWDGMMSNLGERWTDFQRRIGEAGFFDAMSNGLQKVLDTLDRWDANGTIDNIATGLGNTFTAVANVLGAVVERIGTHMGYLIEHFETAKPYLIAFGAALAAITAWAFPVISGFILLGLAIDDFLTYLQGGESMIGSFIDWLSGIPDALSNMLDGFRNLNFGELGRQAGALFADAIIAAVDFEIKRLRFLFVELPQQIAQFFKDISWGAVGEAWVAGMRAQIEAVLGVVVGFAARMNDAIKSWFNVDLFAIGASLGQQLYDGVVSTASRLLGWFQGLIDQMMGMVSGFVGRVEGAISGVRSRLPSWAGGVQSPANMEGVDKMLRGMENLNAHSTKMSAPKTEQFKTLKGDVSNLQNVTVNSTVNQTVQQATDAPGAAAQATERAVTRAANPSRMQTGPAQ